VRSRVLERNHRVFRGRLREQRERHFEIRTRRPAYQSLVADDRAAVEIDDRLKHGGQAALGNQICNAGSTGPGGRAK